MLPLYILFADIAAAVCFAGAVISMILLFSNFEKHLNEHHDDHAASGHGH